MNTLQNILTVVFIVLVIAASVFLYFSNEIGVTVTAVLTIIDLFIIFMIDDDTTHYIGG